MNNNTISEVLSYAVKLGCCCLLNEPLKKHTTFKIGGPCSAMVLANSEQSIASMLRFCTENDIKTLVIGNGSNLLVSDNGFDGVVIVVGKDFQGI